MGDLTKSLLMSASEKDYTGFISSLGEIVNEKMGEKLSIAIEQTEESLFGEGMPKDSVVKDGGKVTRPDKPKAQPKGSLPKVDKKVDSELDKVAFNKKSEAENEDDDETEDDENGEKKKKFNFDKKKDSDSDDKEDSDDNDSDDEKPKKKKFNFDKKKDDDDSDDEDEE